MQLYPTPDNPVPGKSAVMTVTTSDGLALRAARWGAAGGPLQGTVCILQGRAEFIEKYFETVGRPPPARLCGRHLRLARAGGSRRGGSAIRARATSGSFDEFNAETSTPSAIQLLIPYMPDASLRPLPLDGRSDLALNAAPEEWAAVPPSCHDGADDRARGHQSGRRRAGRVSPSFLNALGFGAQLHPGRRRDLDRPQALQGQPAHRRARSATPATPTAATAVGAGAIGDTDHRLDERRLRLMDKFQDPRFGLKVRLPTLIVAAGANSVLRHVRDRAPRRKAQGRPWRSSSRGPGTKS